MRQSDEFTVATGSLGGHATRLDAIADGALCAKAAGDQVRLDSGAYGQLLVFVPTAIALLQSVLADSIGTAGAAIRDTAERVRVAATAYDRSDRATEQIYTYLGGPR